jgi:hypothetical protein
VGDNGPGLEEQISITNDELVDLLESLEIAYTSLSQASAKIEKLERIQIAATSLLQILGSRENRQEPVFIMKKENELSAVLGSALIELDAALGDRPGRDFLVSYERTIH